MKYSKAFLSKVNLILFGGLVFGLLSCHGGIKKKADALAVRTSVNLNQKKSDLLAGVSSAICYSGFRSGQHPDRGNGAVNPSYEEVLQDLMILSQEANLKLIRLYDAGENSQMVLRVIKDNKIPIKVLQGIWLKAEISNHETCAWLKAPISSEILQNNRAENKAEINRGIQLANQYPGIIAAVNVGNEALVEWNDHGVAVDSIISYVRKVKASIKQPVSVADNYKWWAKHGTELAKVVDFVAIHVYPIWEGKDIQEGLSFTIKNVSEVRKALPKSRIVITEAGWASLAAEFGQRASEKKQARYYKDLMTWAAKMNITTFFFEAFDEDWKGDTANTLGAEKHWGLYTVDRKKKKVSQNIYDD